MSFTTIEIVKKHLAEQHIAIGWIDLEPVKITAGSAMQLKYPPVNSGSEKVKAKEQVKPDYQSVTFPTDNQVSLNKSELIRDSFVVASDSSLGCIYKENLDYTVDYNNGTLTRISSGQISAYATVSVWYMPYRVYTRGVDYSIDYTTGKISRISGGDIEPDQWVYIDYVSEYVFLDEDVLKNAINEANEQVLNFIDSIYSSSTDRSLVVAETYLAVAIICRIKALRSISSSTKSNIVSSWSVLADQYKRDAFLLLEKFAGSINSLNAPKKA